jgi:tetratricopeptide (TPR) repeat protein
MGTKRRLLMFFFCAAFALSLWFGSIPFTQAKLGNITIAQSLQANQLVEQGVKLYQKKDYAQAIEQWQMALNVDRTKGDRFSQTIIRENLARAYQQQGNKDKALAYWQKAIAYYRDTKNQQKVGRLLTEQAQIYSSLGQQKKAILLLCNTPQINACLPESALQIARDRQDRVGEAAAKGSLGNAYRLRGNYQQARDYLQASLKIAKEIKEPAYISSALDGLGNTYANLALDRDRLAQSAQINGDTIEATNIKQEAFKYNSQALKYFQENLKITHNDKLAKMRSQLNSISAYYRLGDDAKAEQARKQAFSLFTSLPVDRDKAYPSYVSFRKLNYNRKSSCGL